MRKRGVKEGEGEEEGRGRRKGVKEGEEGREGKKEGTWKGE